jgi:hypothetical protein
LACWFWRRRILEKFSVFLLFRYYLPLEKGYPLPLKKSESPSPKEIGPMVLEEKIFK